MKTILDYDSFVDEISASTAPGTTSSPTKCDKRISRSAEQAVGGLWAFGFVGYVYAGMWPDVW